MAVPGAGEHPLQYNFTFWYSRRTPGRPASTQSYEQNIKPIGSFASVTHRHMNSRWLIYSDSHTEDSNTCTVGDELDCLTVGHMITWLTVQQLPCVCRWSSSGVFIVTWSDRVIWLVTVISTCLRKESNPCGRWGLFDHMYACMHASFPNDR